MTTHRAKISQSIPSGYYFRSCNRVGAVYHAPHHRFVPCTIPAWLRHCFFSMNAPPQTLDAAGAGLGAKSVNPQKLLRRSTSEKVEFLHRVQEKRWASYLRITLVRVACLASQTQEPRQAPKRGSFATKTGAFGDLPTHGENSPA